MSAERNFTEGKLLPHIIKFGLPVLGSTLLQTAYGAADLYIVGKYGTASGVSAVASGSSVMSMNMYLILGLTMGATVLIGQRIGSRDPEGAGRAVGCSAILFTIVAGILTLVMELSAAPLARLIRTPPEAMEQTIRYIRICSAGIIFITGYNVICGIFRGLGNSTLPMLFVLISAIINIFGDLLLCGPLHMDVAGAAIATIAAQGISVLLSFLIIRRTALPFVLRRSSFSLAGGDSPKILRLGLPLALQDVLVHLSFLMVNAFANGFGLIPSAGYGVGNKVIGFLMMIPSAMSASVTAIVSQNVGAGRFKRAVKALRTAIILGLSCGFVICILGFYFSDAMAGFFNKDPDVVAQAALFIRGFAIDCFLTNVLFSFAGFFNGHGRTQVVMFQGLSSALLVRIPLSWFFSRQSWGSLFYLGLATPLTTAYGILYFLICFRVFRHRHPELT